MAAPRNSRSVTLYSTLPKVGGNSTITWGLAQSFRRQGRNVHVIAKQASPGDFSSEVALALEKSGCKVSSVAGLGWQSVSAVWSCRTDTFISIGMGYAAPLLARLGDFRFTCYYYINHDPTLSGLRRLGPLGGVFDSWAMISPTSLPLAARLPFRPRSLCWLPQFSEFVNSKLEAVDPARPLRWGFVGNLRRSKGILQLLRIWSEIIPRDTTLAICGDGEEREAVLRAAAELPNIHYLGAFSASERDEKLAAFFSAIDFLVVPSEGHGEGIPTVILEALSYGVPVLATDGGGVAAFGEGVLAAAFAGGVTLCKSFELAAALLAMRRRSESQRFGIQIAYRKLFSDAVLDRAWANLTDTAATPTIGTL